MSDLDVTSYLHDISTSTARLLSVASSLPDSDVAAPSRLPGWNRAMILTHLARNADGIAGMLDGARRREVMHQYPHGREGRAADIEAGRSRSAVALRADLEAACSRLSSGCALMGPDDWESPCDAFSGRFPVGQMLISRRRELEVHHGDLGLGYGPANWPMSFVAADLDLHVGALPARLGPALAVRLVDSGGIGEWRAGPPDVSPVVVTAPAAQLLAWLLGRPSTVVDPPAIGPYQ